MEVYPMILTIIERQDFVISLNIIDLILNIFTEYSSSVGKSSKDLLVEILYFLVAILFGGNKKAQDKI